MSIAGKWNVTMNTPIGAQKFVWDLQQAGGQWSGSMESPFGKSDLRDVKVNGADVGFSASVNSPMGALDLAFSGAVNGDQISGMCKTRFGDSPFTGERG